VIYLADKSDFTLFVFIWPHSSQYREWAPWCYSHCATRSLPDGTAGWI